MQTWLIIDKSELKCLGIKHIKYIINIKKKTFACKNKNLYYKQKY